MIEFIKGNYVKLEVKVILWNMKPGFEVAGFKGFHLVIYPLVIVVPQIYVYIHAGAANRHLYV